MMLNKLPMPSAGNDGCLVWDTEEKACTALLEGPAVRWAACLDDNNTLLYASGDRTTKVCVSLGCQFLSILCIPWRTVDCLYVVLIAGGLETNSLIFLQHSVLKNLLQF